MKCPHCTIDFHDTDIAHDIGSDVDGSWLIVSKTCSACKRNLYYLKHVVSVRGQGDVVKDMRLIRPKMASRNSVPSDVPSSFGEDYKEACLVLSDSPKASAALSRRCLQSIIRDKMNIKKSDLFQEIQAVIDKALLPADLLESIDAIRNIGNFAAHPIKSQSSGQIVEVEPNEAEWNLDVIEMLFDYLFVRPELVKKKREALDTKLVDAGKNPMK